MYESAEQWFVCHGGRLGCHPLLALPGVSGLSVMADVLHILDLGLAHHALSNVLFLLCWKANYFGRGFNPQQRLDQLWMRVVAQYRRRQTSSRIGALSLSHFTDPARPHQVFPCLSTRIKAAESRHLVPILASIWDDVSDLANEEDSHISLMLTGLSNAYEALECREQRLPRANLAAFESGLDQCLVHYRWLHSSALAAHRSLWHEVPKHHFTQHVKLQASLQNPRFCWCYPDEDFMGYVKSITESCLAGTKAHRAVNKY